MGFWHKLMYKWFGLSEEPCETCEILRMQLAESNAERRDLLTRLLEKDKPIVVPEDKTEYKPITPAYTPWRVRQQMLEAEDRKKMELLRKNADEVEKLEKELEIK